MTCPRCQAHLFHETIDGQPEPFCLYCGWRGETTLGKEASRHTSKHEGARGRMSPGKYGREFKLSDVTPRRRERVKELVRSGVSLASAVAQVRRPDGSA